MHENLTMLIVSPLRRCSDRCVGEGISQPLPPSRHHQVIFTTWKSKHLLFDQLLLTVLCIVITLVVVSFLLWLGLFFLLQVLYKRKQNFLVWRTLWSHVSTGYSKLSLVLLLYHILWYEHFPCFPCTFAHVWNVLSFLILYRVPWWSLFRHLFLYMFIRYEGLSWLSINSVNPCTCVKWYSIPFSSSSFLVHLTTRG